jgi:uncharacterized protein YbaR (Trm112 family)
MKRRLMEFIVCPICAGALDLRPRRMEDEEIMEGELGCGKCGRTYPVVRGVPRLLPERFSDEQRATAAAFGYEWAHFSDLEDTYEKEFLDWIDPVGKEFFPEKLCWTVAAEKAAMSPWLPPSGPPTL